ncbi:MAG: hypothetical protein HC903_24485 [Methylacidiphilales bacterium]|nr:hypothetical protein [Candidatus Methylacidiphilales bacterium]
MKFRRFVAAYGNRILLGNICFCEAIIAAGLSSWFQGEVRKVKASLEVREIFI